MTDQPASRPYVDAPLLTGLDDVDHWDEEAGRARLDRLAPQLPMPIPADARWCSGESNDVWDLGDRFLRVCWRADRDRTAREAALLRALPAEIPHAPLLGHGRTEDLSWLLTERVPGAPLARAARAMAAPQRQALFDQAADILRRLHDWTPPPALRSRLAARPGLDPGEPLSVWAADLLPLPVDRVGAHLELARHLPYVDPGLVDAVGERIASLSDVDPYAEAGTVTVVHGDPSLGNWFVCDGVVTALLDFEWARLGPPDLDLLTPVFAAAVGEQLATPFVRTLMSRCLSSTEMRSLPRRLWLYELCFFLRGVIWWPPNAPEQELDPAHHVHTLRRLLDAPLPVDRRQLHA